MSSSVSVAPGIAVVGRAARWWLGNLRQRGLLRWLCIRQRLRFSITRCRYVVVLCCVRRVVKRRVAAALRFRRFARTPVAVAIAYAFFLRRRPAKLIVDLTCGSSVAV